jgi:hypothetical protein
LTDARPWLRLAAAGDAAALRGAAARVLERQAHDPRAISTWEAFCATSVGTPEWYSVGKVAAEGTVPLKQAVEMYRARRVPVDVLAFRSVVARSLGAVGELPARPIALAQSWLAHDPDAISELVAHAAEPLLLKLARHRATPTPALDVMIRHAQGRVQRAALRARMRRTAMGADRVAFMRMVHPAGGETLAARPGHPVRSKG